MTIDWTVRVWDAVQLAVLLGALLRLYVGVGDRLTQIEGRMDRLERML
jgi:hypothetical protein